MKFDFTPDPKVLIALTHTPMQPLDALCELIDNAIDSFYGAKIQGLKADNPMVIVTLPSRKQLSENGGILRIQDNGPGMSPQNAEKAIKAGFSGNNPYDTLGLFGMGFNISTGKLGNITTFMTSREDMDSYVKTVIDLEKINSTKDYSLDAEKIAKASDDPYFKPGSHGTIIEVKDWWPQGNANSGFVQKLVQYGLPKIREEIGRRYATILRKGEIKIFINEGKCEAYEHCVWDDSRYVVRKSGNVPAVMRFDQVVGSTKRCGTCTAILGTSDTCCPSCGSTKIRTVEERVRGWIGIQRFDSDTDFGIDLIRNGRAIRIGEKNAFFEYVDEFKHVTKDYPIDSQYGRIVGEINLDFVPVDFLKQDFQRSSAEWQRAMTFIRGNSSLQPSQPGASENNSPLYKLYQAYRRVRSFGRGDMYMGYWDADSRSAKRISRDTEKEYYEKFKQKLPGFYDDGEWWKLVESADQPPAEELPECPVCGAQNLKEAEECVACGAILKPKTCVNEKCGKIIPLSAVTCPFCGANQIPTVHIGLGEEYTDPDGTVRTIDREILIMVDSIDHDEDVEQDEYERHTDKVFSDRLARYERSGKSGEDVVNPWDEIEDIKSDPFTLLFPEDAPMDEKVAAILEFMEGLTEAQRDLVYDHLGAWKYLEDVRREEEARTGKTVTQQAISNRWNKIIAKGCKHFGVEKSRKRKK